MAARYVLIDTGYWFGLLTPNDPYTYQAQTISELISEYILVIPFPTMYETLNTNFVKNKKALSVLEDIMKSDKIEFVYDEQYREKALSAVYATHKAPLRHLSLVDCIIREMIEDINLKIDFLVTFNEGDFSDICTKRNITIISDKG